MRSRDFERRVKRIEGEIGDPRCTCVGPGLEIVVLRLGEEPPPPALAQGKCPIHRVEQPGVLRVMVRQRDAVATPQAFAHSGVFHTVLPGGQVLVHLPEPG